MSTTLQNLAPIGIIAILLTPWVISKIDEMKHPDEIRFDPEHDSPELLAFILNKQAREKNEQWEAYWHD